MEKKVTVLTPNARRQNVKVTPNTTLLQILEETCEKHGLDSDDYGLMHHNKDIDLTQMFRFSGLPNNCLLEMSYTERKRIALHVEICLQLEDGTRKQGKFKPSDDLWHVAAELAEEAVADYESPVAIYMRQEVIGKTKMAATTLKSLGITEGRALVRFINKNPEILKTQANVYISPAVKEKTNVDAAPREARSTTANNTGGEGGGGFAITSKLVQSLKQLPSSPAIPSENAPPDELTNFNKVDKQKDIKPVYDWGTGSGRTIRSTHSAQLEDERPENEMMETEIEEEPEVIIIGERNAILYSMDATQKQILDLPDSFFDLTVTDLKMVLRDLKEIATGNENAPLLTVKLREFEENKMMLKKIAKYKICVIRVQFPDRHVLQGIFKPIDTIAQLLDFVRVFLHDQNADFHLFTIPPKSVLPSNKTLLELDFVPTAVVHFAFADEGISSTEQSYLKAEYLKQLTSAEGAIFAANKWRIANRTQTDTSGNGNNENATNLLKPKSPGSSTGAIPKRSRNDSK